MRIVTLTTTFRTNPCCWRIASILPARKGNSPFGVCNRNRRMACNSNSHSSCYSLNPMQKKKVAVIGAGAAGLVAARELHREGHEVSVFEQSSHVGGTWIYDPSIEQDPLGLHPSRNIVHSSMYASLRTNLPRDVMGFSDYAFRYCPETDCRRFPGHHEVALYIRSFAQHFGLLRFIKFNTRVERVCRMGESGESCVKWKVQSRHSIGGDANVPVQQQEREETEVEEGIYDAVVVCNGHHTQPRIAAIPGIKKWPGKQIHSHNYRIPDPFRGKVVVVIGNSASGSDISQELTSVAKEVHLSARSIKSDDVKNARCFKKIMLHPMVQSLLEDGTVKFQDGNAIVADSIIHCTGYCYHFPFLETDNIVTVEDNCVGPLYKHIFPPLLAPSLSFVGLPWKVLPFIMFELQSRWIAKLLSGKVELPPENEMMEDVASFYSEFNKSGRPKHQTHMLGDIQFEYDNWLCDQCGCMRVEEWRKEIYFANTDNRKSNLEMYRDKWSDHYWLEMATLDLSSRTGYGNLSNPSQ